MSYFSSIRKIDSSHSVLYNQLMCAAMIGGMGLPGSRISTRNLGLLYNRTQQLAELLQHNNTSLPEADSLEFEIILNNNHLNPRSIATEYGAKLVTPPSEAQGTNNTIKMVMPGNLSLPVILALLESDTRIKQASLQIASKQSFASSEIAITSDSVKIGEQSLRRKITPGISG